LAWPVSASARHCCKDRLQLSPRRHRDTYSALTAATISFTYRNPGNIFIKVDPTKGSTNLALGTQQIPVGAGIAIHRHFEMDDAFCVLEGGGKFILNDQLHSFEKGGTIHIPKNA
jgi:quercetin dioxygenase-like cupin family protein